MVTSSRYYYSPFSPSAIQELRAAASNVNPVVPEPGRLMAELADADGILGVVNPEMLRAARKLILQGPEIGDHALALLLALTRELHRAIPNRTLEEWNPQRRHPIELQGRTAVVIGVGGLGTQIAARDGKEFGLVKAPEDHPWSSATKEQAGQGAGCGPGGAAPLHLFTDAGANVETPGAGRGPVVRLIEAGERSRTCGRRGLT